MSKKTEFKETSSNGSTIVVLSEEFQFKGDTVGRVTIPALRGKHIARLSFALDVAPSVAEVVEWAGYVVEPVGCVDEMHPRDALAIAWEVYSHLGKSLATGESPSE